MGLDPREARRQAFLDRQQKSKQISSGGGLGFFKGDLQEVNYWNCEEGDHDIDVIPYIAGPNDPHKEEGEWTYVLEVFEHRDVGGEEGKSMICLLKTFGLPCPICEHRQQLVKEEADEDVIKALRTSKYPRSIYNVVVYDTEKEEDKGVQVFHTSHWLMERHMVKLAESNRRDIELGHPAFKFFADPDEGYSIRFTRTGKSQNTQFLAHQLVERNYVISDEILEQAYQLDQLIHVPTYEEVYEAYWNEKYPGDGEESEASATRAPRGESRRGGRREQVQGESEEGGEVDYTPPKQQRTAGGKGRGRGGASSPPATTRATRGAAKGRGAPPKRGKQKQEEPAPEEEERSCPGGGEFGVSAYELPHCEKCDIWEPCYELNKKLLAQEGRGGEEEGGYEEDAQFDEEQVEEEKPSGRGVVVKSGRSTRGGRGATKGGRVSKEKPTQAARATRGAASGATKAGVRTSSKTAPRAGGRATTQGRGRATAAGAGARRARSVVR
jgi:hypothetical protein